jgi:hypothetical protein
MHQVGTADQSSRAFYVHQHGYRHVLECNTGQMFQQLAASIFKAHRRMCCMRCTVTANPRTVTQHMSWMPCCSNRGGRCSHAFQLIHKHLSQQGLQQNASFNMRLCRHWQYA